MNKTLFALWEILYCTLKKQEAMGVPPFELNKVSLIFFMIRDPCHINIIKIPNLHLAHYTSLVILTSIKLYSNKISKNYTISFVVTAKIYITDLCI